VHKPDPVETVLARLMPAALSENGQAGIEAMLDELAETAPAADSAVVRRVSGRRWMISGGIAAAAAGIAALLVFPITSAPSQPGVAVNDSNSSNSYFPEVVLLDETDRIESMTDEGWQEDFDGSSMRVMRLSVVQENSFLDEETGIVMQVSQPREEMLLMPVSTF
jgi:hypothetical protein